MDIKIEQNLRTEKVTSELITYIVRKIVKEIQPEKIILFGSYARSDFNSDSDLDLFIIKDSDESTRILRRKIDALLRGRRFSIDLLVRTPEDVARNMRSENPFYLHHIFKYGKTLYEKSG